MAKVERVREMPSTPMHYLFADRNREAQLSEYCVRAFGDPLTVHRYGGSQITLHLGRPSLPEPLPPQNADYVAELDQLPLVSEQGDGLRAFIGMLLATGTREYPLILIDEPEAFLHPPQARILGRLLVEISTSRGQVIVSTHSDDIVQGILSAQATREVSVVRLTRSGSNMNRVSQLQPKAVRELYEDQLFRYSRVLDGLFYSGVVLCEAEADCRFYGAIFDVLREQEGFEHFRRLDLHFTHCGGKDRIHRAVAALRAVRVPVACATDIDILQDHGKLDQLVQSLGGDLAHLRSKINILHSAITAKNQPVKRSVAQHAIGEILAESASPNIAPDEAARIRALLQERSGWADVKTKGRGALDSGDPTTAFDTVVGALHNTGLFIVPVGELERFVPDIPSANKAVWLRHVFEQDRHRDCDEATRYVAAIANYLYGMQSSSMPADAVDNLSSNGKLTDAQLPGPRSPHGQVGTHT